MIKSVAMGKPELRAHGLIFDYIDTRHDLVRGDFEGLSLPMLCVWYAVELTYDLKGVGPSGPTGFTLQDFVTNLETTFPELSLDYGERFPRTLMEQYLSMLEYLAPDRAQSAAVAGRLDQAVDDLMRSDLPNTAVH